MAIVAHLGLPTEAPPIARARSPGFDFKSAATANGSSSGLWRDDVGGPVDTSDLPGVK